MRRRRLGRRRRIDWSGRCVMPEPRPGDPRGRIPERIDPDWWRGAVIDGRPVREILAARDIGPIFRFLRTQGWSLTALCAATGMSETRIRSVMQDQQRVTSYEVLERIAVGLRIP